MNWRNGFAVTVKRAQRDTLSVSGIKLVTPCHAYLLSESRSGISVWHGMDWQSVPLSLSLRPVALRTSKGTTLATAYFPLSAEPRVVAQTSMTTRRARNSDHSLPRGVAKISGRHCFGRHIRGKKYLSRGTHIGQVRYKCAPRVSEQSVSLGS